MTSWIRLWPMLLIPYVVLCVIGLIPTLHIFGRDVGGPYIREWVLNECLLPLLPQSAAIRIVDGFAHATVAQEFLLHALIMLNVYALVFPLLFGFGMLVIKYSVWSTATDLALKRRALKQ